MRIDASTQRPDAELAQKLAIRLALELVGLTRQSSVTSIAQVPRGAAKYLRSLPEVPSELAGTVEELAGASHGPSVPLRGRRRNCSERRTPQRA